MKHLLILLICTFLSANAFAQQKESPDKPKQEVKQTSEAITDGPVLKLDGEVVDYGEIERHSEPLRTLAFTNTGTAPLVIKNARGSCGCTVPTWPKEPIMPGETSQIEVRYATNRLGKINKSITLTTNETGKNKHIIRVIGKVFEEEEAIPTGDKNIFDGGGK